MENGPTAPAATTRSAESLALSDDHHGPRSPIRLLLACTGWPSGLIDLASWASRRNLAKAVVFQMQPGPPFQLDPAITKWAQHLPSSAVREAMLEVGSEFIRKLIEWRPHVVGFRVEGESLQPVRRFIRAVRWFCDTEIVLGGPTASSHPREVLHSSGADYVFDGEAEEPLAQWLRLARLRNSVDRQPEIPGLTYRYGGRVYHNTLPRDGYERNALDAGEALGTRFGKQVRQWIRPHAPTELIAANRLDWSLLENFRRPNDSLYFTAGRGCPGVCTFCAKLHGTEVRTKSAEQLIEEIEAANARVAAGALVVTQWRLFEHVDDPAWRDGDPPRRDKRVAWAAVYDEDFFLKRRRAIEFFELWARNPLRHRYRISVQTNPVSLLTSAGRVHGELLEWIDRVKPMVQLGAESFHRNLLTRWRKRHNVDQLDTVLNALDHTRQDYTAFQLLTDFETTPDELVETLRRLIVAAFSHRRMRIAASPYTIPLYESPARRRLELEGKLPPGRVRDFTDYQRPQPEWMDPLAAELADLADAELQWALDPRRRDTALTTAMEAVLEKIRSVDQGDASARRLLDQAEQAMNQIRDARFQWTES